MTNIFDTLPAGTRDAIEALCNDAHNRGDVNLALNAMIALDGDDNAIRFCLQLLEERRVESGMADTACASEVCAALQDAYHYLIAVVPPHGRPEEQSTFDKGARGLAQRKEWLSAARESYANALRLLGVNGVVTSWTGAGKSHAIVSKRAVELLSAVRAQAALVGCDPYTGELYVLAEGRDNGKAV